MELPTGEIINLEMYTKYDRNASIKSVMYVTSIFSSQLKVALTKQVIQINFVKDNKYKNDKMIKKYTLMEQSSLVDKIIPELFQIIVINVVSEEKILYNKREKDFYLLMKLINAETLEEMEEVVKGNEIMEKILEEMKKFSEEEYVQDYHTQEVLIKSQHNNEMKESKEEVVRKMLLKGFKDSDIIEVTNISSKDLEKIKLNMKEA